MSKELLEDLDSGIEVKTEYGVCYAYSPDVVEEFRQALQRLEAIDNAEPSEALECLNKIVESFNETTTGMYGLGEVVVANDLIYNFKEELDTIKQALLKAQEPKQYLKWEDLDTKPYTMKVKMGDNLYMLDWRYSNNDDYDNSKLVTLRTLNGDWLFTLEKYFFNDLHLERVKE